MDFPVYIVYKSDQALRGLLARGVDMDTGMIRAYLKKYYPDQDVRVVSKNEAASYWVWNSVRQCHDSVQPKNLVDRRLASETYRALIADGMARPSLSEVFNIAMIACGKSQQFVSVRLLDITVVT